MVAGCWGMFFVAPPFQQIVEQAMGGRWNTCKFQIICFVVLILGSAFQGSSSLNLEGSILLKFQARLFSDPYNSLASWHPEDYDPCNWFGVNCVDGEVQMLDLSGLSLGGTLAPELGDLVNLRALMLHSNHLSGTIPAEFGYLTKLEVLDLRDNNLTGRIPAEIANLVSLKQLLLCDNNFEGPIPPELEDLSLLSELQFGEKFASVANQNFDHWTKFATESSVNEGDNHIINLESSYELNLHQNKHNLAGILRRRLLEQSSNLEAVPPKTNSLPQITSQPISRSSGSFPAVANEKNPTQASLPSVFNPQNDNKPTEAASDAQSQPGKARSSGKVWVYVTVSLGSAFLLLVVAALFIIWRRRKAKPIGPFKTGISGQLQKAFVTGVPKLNRPELETACEDFSNIVATFDGFTVYKGTLSSGVEIAVGSTIVTSSADWSQAAELAYRKKIETLSRVNHKNFVNLLGYCEEAEPFTRMMVFEYAPSGSLFEHLHVKEVEHLDWNARMRAIMGAAYCLQYMHHDLNPPVAHSNLTTSSIYLTDDYAAKIAERPFEIVRKAMDSVEDGSSPAPEFKTPADPAENVYCFGMVLLEVITGRLLDSEEHGSLIDWAMPILTEKENIKDLIDPILKSVKMNELEVICEVIQDCIKPNPLQRPTMKEVTSRLREVIPIAPEAAVPRLSPLWWAELEILSVEAA